MEGAGQPFAALQRALSTLSGVGGSASAETVSATGRVLVAAHSSKVAGRPASSRSASAGGQPFSRRQRARISFVDDTNEIDCYLTWPLLMYRRCTIHCRRSVASAHLPEIASCRSAMGSAFYTFRKSLLSPKARDVTYRQRKCLRVLACGTFGADLNCSESEGVRLGCRRQMARARWKAGLGRLAGR